nr:unnamed protein product [Digitaria exilis]
MLDLFPIFSEYFVPVEFFPCSPGGNMEIPIQERLRRKNTRQSTQLQSPNRDRIKTSKKEAREGGEMQIRTPEMVARAIRMLPPAQDAGIELGEERYNAEEVSMDLLLHGRVLGPREEAEKAEAAGVVGRWEEAWKNAPLVIQDAPIVKAITALAPELAADVVEKVSSEAIWHILDGEEEGEPPVHQGLVGCVRIEAPSGCPPPDVVGGRWMERITAVRADHPVAEAFPLRGLPAGLRSLALAFFTSSNPLDATHLTHLSELRLTGCDFSGLALSRLIPELCSLRVLELGYCRLTQQCRPEGLTLVSSSLVCLDMWSCTALGGVSLQYTPKLQLLCAGVRPQDRGGARINIEIRTAGALRGLDGLVLPWHELSYITPYQGRVRLRVCLKMADIHQMIDLLDLLRHLPHLGQLILLRIDGTDPTEAIPSERLSNIPSITSSLQVLALHNFRGGVAEIGFAKSIIFKACQLKTVELQPHPVLTPQALSEAITHLTVCSRASQQGRMGVQAGRQASRRDSKEAQVGRQAAEGIQRRQGQRRKGRRRNFARKTKHRLGRTPRPNAHLKAKSL